LLPTFRSQGPRICSGPWGPDLLRSGSLETQMAPKTQIPWDPRTCSRLAYYDPEFSASDSGLAPLRAASRRSRGRVASSLCRRGGLLEAAARPRRAVQVLLCHGAAVLLDPADRSAGVVAAFGVVRSGLRNQLAHQNLKAGLSSPRVRARLSLKVPFRRSSLQSLGAFPRINNFKAG